MGEREIFGDLPGGHGPGPDGEPTGPNVERLLDARAQAAAFGVAANRAFDFAERQSSSAKDILDSIRNTGGQ